MGDKVIGVVLVSLLITLGFLIDEERSMSVDTREVVVHLVDAIDEIQDLASNGRIDMDKSINIREDIVEIIKRLDEAELR